MASAIVRSLNRLTRDQLIDLVLVWLEKPAWCPPYLHSNRTMAESNEEDYLFPPANSLRELKDFYKGYSADADTEISKSYIVDRIVDGDWRRGLTLYQHATVDFEYLNTHDTALRWTGLKIVPLEHNTTTSAANSAGEPPFKKTKRAHTSTTNPAYPTISPETFVNTLRAQINALVKADYQLQLVQNIPILRLHLVPDAALAPSPDNIPRVARHATDTGRAIYIALPPSSGHVYVALSGPQANTSTSDKAKAKTDIMSLKKLVIEAIPKALSRPHERWALESTKLTASSLRGVCHLRGGTERPGTAGGSYSGFYASTDATAGAESGPADILGRHSAKNKRSHTTFSDEDEEESEGELQRMEPGQLPESQMFFPDTTVNTRTEKPQKYTKPTPKQLISRFGHINDPNRAKLDRVQANIRDIFRAPITDAESTEMVSLDDRNPVRVSLKGDDVIKGLRMLAALGLSGKEDSAAQDEMSNGSRKGKDRETATKKAARFANDTRMGLDLDQMPGWMAGERGESFTAV